MSFSFVIVLAAGLYLGLIAHLGPWLLADLAAAIVICYALAAIRVGFGRPAIMFASILLPIWLIGFCVGALLSASGMIPFFVK